ncbi:hypothetical protein SAMN04487959_10293 [Modicisalibacter xianhensis]|uniref:Phosphate-selective porin O and P n=2 Tax=Modicisalibacter xianhensis TaxID=442341 RepID=A0A1I2YRE3_9GAMM|nr:hypothetical protein SAMN04487959_10293 [Halomonas xianhensis]
MTVSMSYRLSISRLLSGSGFIATVLCASPTAMASENIMGTLQVHGFLSQAWIVSEDNDFFGPSSEHGGSFQYTEIGANASLRPHRDVLLAAQVLGRQAGDTSEEGPVLDYGVIDYQMVSNRHRTIGFQAGRFKNPFGFYNQTRDVAFTRPSILLPQSIYFDRTRSLGLAGDGVSVYHEERFPGGTLRTQIGYGAAQADDDLRQTLRLDAVAGSLDPADSAIGQVRYDHASGNFVAALSVGHAKAEFDSSENTISDGTFRFNPWVLSFQYNQELWSLTMEYALRNSSLSGFDNPRFNYDVTGESWYLQYARRFHEDWQWLVRYDSLVSNRSDPDGTDYQASGAGPAHTQFAKDVTLGLQWTPHPQLMLAAEYHNVDGTGWLPIQDNPDPQDTERYWQMLLFQLSLRF